MSYKKLSEVELVATSTEPNILIEEDGDIKRISASNVVTPQVQADWNEDDPTEASYILNKPESLGGGKVITYTDNSGLMLNGAYVTPQEVVDEWNAGSILRYQIGSKNISNIIAIDYYESSGSITSCKLFFINTDSTVISKDV